MFINYLNKLDLTYVSNVTEELIENQLSIKQFHNKRYYAKYSGKHLKVLELTLAWELFKSKSKVISYDK